MGFFDDVFSSVFGVAEDIYDATLKPIVDPVYNGVIRPVFDTAGNLIGSAGNIASNLGKGAEGLSGSLSSLLNSPILLVVGLGIAAYVVINLKK